MTDRPDAPHFDRIAPDYARVCESWESVYKRIGEEINPLIRGKKVLDVGNGGFFPYDVALASEITVLDISPAMLERIRTPGIRKIVGDARSLEGIADGSCDVVLFLLFLHHLGGKSVGETLKRLDEALDAAKRKLKNGGTLFIAEPVLPLFLYQIERAAFPATAALLHAAKVGMIFFYGVRVVRDRLAARFGVSENEVSVIPIPVRGWVDPLGGSFPGRVKIPWWLCPTQYYLLKVRKPC